jgi:prepilin-type N-terminal cleavage/methylation domain-containing protein
MKTSNKGFTLIELVVVMAVFIVIIMITGDAFNTILKQTTKLSKSEESNIEGVVGLEMMRHDLEQAGFGLPQAYDPDASKVITYLEAGYLPANTYNDAPSGVPRAFVAGNNLGAVADPNSYTGGVKYNVLANTDYLVIKASSVGTNDAAQKWTYTNYSGATYGSKPPKVWPGGNLKTSDKVIMLRRTFANGVYTNRLAYDNSDATSRSIYWVSHSNIGYVPAFSPATPEEIIYEYGIASTNLGMPFNRADYFVAIPTLAERLPTTCVPNKTGVLYKTSLDHTTTNPGGKLTYMPILDCVADMQVIFGWDLADSAGIIETDPLKTVDGQIDTWSNADGSAVSGVGTIAQVQAAMADAGHVRTKLKIVKVLILAQIGSRDPGYTSPSPLQVGEPGEESLTKPGGFVLTSDMLNYRWKVYKLIIKPKNLLSNQ